MEKFISRHAHIDRTHSENLSLGQSNDKPEEEEMEVTLFKYSDDPLKVSPEKKRG